MLNFKEFHTRYPQGAILSELVALDHGKYIVRSLLQVDGVTLASGLGSGYKVEEAEDLARERALAIVNLTPPSITKTPVPTVDTKTDTKTSVVSIPTTPPSVERNFVPPTPIPKTISIVEEMPTPIPSTIPTTFEQPISILPEPPVTPAEVSPKVELDNVIPFDTNPPSNVPALYQDIIAKTDIELKRLGWTKEQGREYLVRNYGKKTRALLKDEELLEFLQYLEGLPNPQL